MEAVIEITKVKFNQTEDEKDRNVRLTEQTSVWKNILTSQGEL
jgi:hypothetical protein